MNKSRVYKIVSGGQTGIDRIALDVAMYLDLEHGGWCPQGRKAEDGVIPANYRLKECESPEYYVRTERNVVDSDGTLILFTAPMSGGTKLTAKYARKHRRPLLSVDLSNSPDGEQAKTVRHWLLENNIAVLNVAGPRASSNSLLPKVAEQFLVKVFQEN